MLVLDTFRRFHKCDENDSAAMARILCVLEGVAKRTGCSIVFVHHANKSAAVNGQGDMQHASRGSSVLVDHVRWQMYLAVASKEEAKTLGIDEKDRGYYIRVGLSKQNYGPPSSNLCWLRRSDGGVLVTANFGIRSAPIKKDRRRAEI